MRDLRERFKPIEILTFDCYGTLIDWRTGLNRSLEELFGAAAGEAPSELYRSYVPEEARVEREGYRPYREVLATTATRVARQLGTDLPLERAARLADMVPDWPPFPDTVPALKQLAGRFRLGVLSNIDRDIFDKTAKTLGIEFDFVITAQDVRSYKPGSAHFDKMMRDHGDADRVVHIAQSLFHDGQPAERLDLAFVWINRYNDANLTSVRPLATFADLQSFADACT